MLLPRLEFLRPPHPDRDQTHKLKFGENLNQKINQSKDSINNVYRSIPVEYIDRKLYSLKKRRS